LLPRYIPQNISGIDTPNHITRIFIRVLKETTTDDPSTQRIRFIMKKSPKTNLRGRGAPLENNVLPGKCYRHV
jgi:hypothetical protein